MPNNIVDSETGVVAVDASDGTAGEIVFMTARGTIPIPALRDAWEEAGLDTDLLPSQPTEENALRRAVKSVKVPGQLLRPLRGVTGFALVTEHATGEELEYDTDGMLKAKVVYDTTDPTNAIPTVVVKPHDHRHADAIRTVFNDSLNELANCKIGLWIWGRLAPHCRAVSLRDTGGMYFIPPDAVEEWHKFREVIQAVSAVRVYRIPALRCEDAVDAILDAVQREAQESIEKMAAEIEATGDEALGARALHTREDRTRKVREKVRHYEALFARALPDLQGKLDELDADISSALLLAEGEDD